MADLNLTGQNIEYSTIAPKLLRLKQLMDERKVIWAKIPVAKRKLWVTSEKDPIMNVAYDVFKYLENNFFGEGYYRDDT